MAPEQANNSRRADVRADIYSLGCSLYYLLSGQVPHHGTTLTEKIIKHALDAPTPLSRQRSDLPAGLVPILDRMMAKDPGDRYQTPAEVVAALAPFHKGAQPVPAPRAGKRWKLALAAIVLLGLAGTVVALNWTRTPAVEPEVAHPAPAGFLEFRDADPLVEILVKRDGKAVATLSRTSSREQLEPGAYTLQIIQGSSTWRLVNDNVVVVADETATVTVTPVKLPPGSSAPPPVPTKPKPVVKPPPKDKPEKDKIDRERLDRERQKLRDALKKKFGPKG